MCRFMTETPPPSLHQAASASLVEAALTILEVTLEDLGGKDQEERYLLERAEIICAALPHMLAAIRALQTPPD